MIDRKVEGWIQSRLTVNIVPRERSTSSSETDIAEAIFHFGWNEIRLILGSFADEGCLHLSI